MAGPLNVLAGPGAPTVAALAGLGVARISLGSSIAEAAYAVARRAARELLATGTYESLTGALDYGRLNTLLGSRPGAAPHGDTARHERLCGEGRRRT